jgi:DNA-binding response OmpR family regulator
VVAKGAIVTTSKKVGAGADVRTRRVLVVEDDRSLSTLLVYMLSREGYEVASVGDGVGALAAVRRFRPNVLVLDLGLPGLSGDDVCRAVRAESEIADTFVLVLTALDDTEARRRVRDAGADCYMCKPFDPSRLLALVDDVCVTTGGARSATETPAP